MNFGFFYLDREDIQIPKLGRMCPERLFKSFVVGVNGMCFNKSRAKDADMILTTTTGLYRALKGALLICQ